MIRWKRSFEIFFDWPLCWWYWKWKNHWQVLKNPCIIATHPRLSETAQQTFFGLQDVLKTSSRHVLETSSASLQRHNFLSSRTSCKYVFKMSWRRLWRRMAKTNILVLIKTSWRRLEDVLKTSSEDIFKTSSEDEDERRLQDVFKMSWSRRMLAGSSHRVLYLKFSSSYDICIIYLHVIEACFKVTIAMLYL